MEKKIQKILNKIQIFFFFFSIEVFSFGFLLLFAFCFFFCFLFAFCFLLFFFFAFFLFFMKFFVQKNFHSERSPIIFICVSIHFIHCNFLSETPPKITVRIFFKPNFF